MHQKENIEYFMALSYFNEAELKGQQLFLGNFDTNIWLHKENIHLDTVLDAAKKFADARIFIISRGLNKGFYIYSKQKEQCIRLSAVKLAQAV